MTVGGKHIDHVKQASLSKYNDLCTGRHLLGVSFVTNPKSILCTVLTTWNSAEKKRLYSNAQNTTALQPVVFVTGLLC
jgi:hypothetical protein